LADESDLGAMFVLPSLHWVYYYAAAIAVGAVALLLLAVLLVLRRRPPAPLTLLERVTREANKAEAANDDRQDHWMLPAAMSGDRRQKARRVGKFSPIRVKTTSKPEPVETEEGIVLDRSPLGLCFATERQYQVGDTLYVLPVADLADVPWAAVTVRNCRAKENYFLIGCEFQQALPWGVLLLFG
jgi:hypothetical protein